MRLLLPLAIFAPLLAVTAPDTGSTAAEGGSVVGLIVFAALAIGFSFFCSVAEAVLLSVTPSFIATLAEKRQRTAARWEALKQNVDRPLAAILTLNTIAHTVGAAGVGAQAAAIWGSTAVGWASGLMTLMILVLSEIIPKTLGALHWRALAPATGHAIDLLIKLLYPFVWMSELITRVMGGNRQEVVTREEVAAMANISMASGELDPRESEILRNLFRLPSLTAHDIMTPRPVLVTFPEDATVGEVIARQDPIPVSRIPVYTNTVDHVSGFVLKTDILLAQAEDRPETPLRELRRPVKTVPSSTPLMSLLDTLMRERAHLAMVIDEFGGTDGLVTMQDLIETLLGIEIVDEADTTVDLRQAARQQWKRRVKSLGLDLHDLDNPPPKRTEPPRESHPDDGPDNRK